MIIGKVIGNVWATCKYPGLDGAIMQLVQPISGDGKNSGSPIAALDTVGACPGETIIYVTAYEAVIPLKRGMVPVDASIIGIVDSISIAKKKE